MAVVMFVVAALMMMKMKMMLMMFLTIHLLLYLEVSPNENDIGPPFLYSRDDQANSLVCSY